MRTISRRRRRTRLRTTADPSAREVTNPARKGPTSFNETTLITSSRPRWTRPFFLTCSNSDGFVNRRPLGNVNCFAGMPLCHVERSRDISKCFRSEIVRDSSTSVGMTISGTAKVFRPAGAGRKTSQMIRSAVYGEGEVLTLMSVFVSVLVAGDGLTIVVFVSFFSVFSAGGLVTVVSFCSQAAKSAAPIKRQMYLFM